MGSPKVVNAASLGRDQAIPRKTPDTQYKKKNRKNLRSIRREGERKTRASLPHLGNGKKTEQLEKPRAGELKGSGSLCSIVGKKNALGPLRSRIDTG